MIGRASKAVFAEIDENSRASRLSPNFAEQATFGSPKLTGFPLKNGNFIRVPGNLANSAIWQPSGAKIGGFGP